MPDYSPYFLRHAELCSFSRFCERFVPNRLLFGHVLQSRHGLLDTFWLEVVFLSGSDRKFGSVRRFGVFSAVRFGSVRFGGKF